MLSAQISASLLESPLRNRTTFADPRVGKLQWVLLSTIEGARCIDTRSVEGNSHAQLCRKHLPAVRSVLEDIVSVFNTLITTYELEAEVSGAEDSGVFHSVFEDIVATPTDGDPRQQVADVAFMARWELIRKLDGLAGAEQLERWDLIAACSSALRRAIKAVCGVEQVLAEVEGHPSMLTNLYQTHLGEALMTRSAYLGLITQLRGIEARQQQLGATRCLRLVGVAIAKLVGQEIYEVLRVEDRRTLYELQARVLDWLRGGQDGRAGEQLLSDALALGTLLMQINRRPELIGHDRACFEQLIAGFRRPFGAPLDINGWISAVRGRDPEFDVLAESCVGFADLQAAAACVLAQLGPG